MGRVIDFDHYRHLQWKPDDLRKLLNLTRTLVTRGMVGDTELFYADDGTVSVAFFSPTCAEAFMTLSKHRRTYIALRRDGTLMGKHQDLGQLLHDLFVAGGEHISNSNAG